MRRHTIMNEPGEMIEELAIPIYEICVRGVLGAGLLNAFPALTGATTGSDTVLSGELPDQAALHGVISQIESLGLELLSVQQVTRQ
jgi:hypothetical protein